MRAIRPSFARRLAVAWLVVLAMAAGAFAPALQALQIADAGPGHEICTAMGMVSADGSPSPMSGSGANAKHCPWCVIHTVAGMPPAEPVSPHGVALVSFVPVPSGEPALRAATPRYAAPRGPPLLG